MKNYEHFDENQLLEVPLSHYGRPGRLSLTNWRPQSHGDPRLICFRRITYIDTLKQFYLGERRQLGQNHK